MPAPAHHTDLLSKTDMFARLTAEELEKLATIGKTIPHKAAKIIVRQGDPSDAFHMVLSGSFDCYLWDDMMKIERPLCVFKKGEIFGEMGLLTEEPRSAFVRAKEDGETLSFDKKAFLTLLEKDPKLVLCMARTIAHRLNLANKSRGLRLEQLSSFKIDKATLEMLPLQVILRHKVLPVDKAPAEVTVALVDPSDQVARNTVTEFLRKVQVKWVCISQPDFEGFRDKQLFDLLNAPGERGAETGAEITYFSSGSEATEANTPGARLLDELIRDAIDSHASDLHFEPGPNGIGVRARIDGRLVELCQPLTFHAYKPVISRVKVLAEMDITESRLPQDSTVRLKYGSRVIDMRISTVPSPRAEAMACRLFDPTQTKLDLDHLILSEKAAEMVRKLFFLPSGLVLVTGATGSGKTTTLYAGLHDRQKHSTTHKIVTVEDPIEYEIPGTTQVQINTAAGLTFESVLRSALRQDPDIILVGEIRDKTTMEIALEAALTGHLVLSSIHTNGVFETVNRIRQRGIEPYVVGSALRGIISQALLPRLCAACAEVDQADEKLTNQLWHAGLLEAAEKPSVWSAKGCTVCKMTGYKGRVSLLEVLHVTTEVREAIEAGVSAVALAKSVPPGAYLSMRRYGRFLLEKGLVSPVDLLAVLPPVGA